MSLEKLLLNPLPPIRSKINPPTKKKAVGPNVPAGASVPAEELAISAGKSPIVKVKTAEVDPEVMETALSPERSAEGVHDQLPEESAVAETD